MADIKKESWRPVTFYGSKISVLLEWMVSTAGLSSRPDWTDGENFHFWKIKCLLFNIKLSHCSAIVRLELGQIAFCPRRKLRKISKFESDRLSRTKLKKKKMPGFRGKNHGPVCKMAERTFKMNRKKNTLESEWKCFVVCSTVSSTTEENCYIKIEHSWKKNPKNLRLLPNAVMNDCYNK